jgi:hypothetical protein
MKLNTNLIIGAALLGGGAYYAYTKGWFGKKPPIGKSAEQIAKEQAQAELDKIAAQQAAAAAAAAAIVKTKNEIKQASTITNPKSFAGKVSDIQKALGIKEDGNPGTSAGSQTNKNYAAVYGLDKGIISTANIDYYKSKVDNRLTLVAQKAAAQKEAAKKAAAVNVANDAKKFLELVNKGKYKATVNKDFIANAYTYDSLKSVYVDIKEPRKFSKGDRFSYGQFSKSPRGAYVMWHKGGNPSNNILYAFNPADFLVTL